MTEWERGTVRAPHIALGEGGEFDTIRSLLSQWGTLASGIGDDAAVFTPPEGEQLVLSTDTSREGVHFVAGWLTPEEVGARAAAAAFSDVAAMGARALAVLVAFDVPESWRDQLPRVAAGIGHVVHEADARIIGGNISRSDSFGLTLTVIGSTTAPVRRIGAREGDALWVTGSLGGPRLALATLQRGETPTNDARTRFARPMPRLREGSWLAAVGAHAMIDISDGLAADAAHLATASAVICELWADAIPRVAGATVEDALASGEEYELLVATAPDLDVDGFARRFGVPLTQIGVVRAVVPGESPRVVLNEGDAGLAAVRVDLPAGHDHFSE